MGLSNGQLVLVAIAAESPHVGHPDQVVAILGRGEEDSRVAANFPTAVVVIGEVQWEHRESVVGQLAAGPVRFDDVDLALQRVSGGAGVEKAAALAVDGVELHPRVGAPGHPEILDHLATHVDKLVETHFFPVFQPGLVAARVDRAERDGRVPDGS